MPVKKTVNASKKYLFEPKPGTYESVLPGNVVLDVYLSNSEPKPEAMVIKFGEQVVLYSKSLLSIRRSEILQMGYIVPIEYIDEETAILVDAEIDENNLNIMNDELLELKLSTIKSTKHCKDFVDKLTSPLTINRFMKLCEEKDKPKSYYDICESRVITIAEETENILHIGTGNIPDERMRLLTRKIGN